ncbi:MAG: ferric reductase-like transmembrane domain-containing protein [Chloroflexi bacterium]|nr:ferric reductase-like transmembrane domain-containing protein [Chloroflexota bacterium]
MSRKTNWLRLLLHLALLLPLALLIWDLTQNQLTANPIEAATRRTGKTALILLVLSLSCTPAYHLISFWREMAGAPAPPLGNHTGLPLRTATVHQNSVRFGPFLWLRRTLGLYAFAYAAVHLLIFVGLDYGFDTSLIQDGVLEKRHAIAGMSAFLLLLPLAVTSTTGWRRRLGRSWTLLHRAVYAAALVAAVHYLWGVKVDTRQPLQYIALVLLLLLLRLPILRAFLTPWRSRLTRHSPPQY